MATRKRTRNEDKLKGGSDSEALAKARLELSRSRRSMAELKALLRHHEERNEQLADELAGVVDIVDLVAAAKPKPIKANGKRGPLPQATYVAVGSDWHMGARVRKREVRGLNEFSPAIAAARAEQFFKRNLLMLQAARSAWDIRRVLLALLGDLMENFLHEENYSENCLTPQEELPFIFEVLVAGIRYILDHYDVEELLIATAHGNHGRDTKRMHAAGSFRRSHEFMLYKLLMLHFKDEPRVKWQLGMGYEHVVNLYGFKVRLSHGDGIRFHGGVGGISPALYRRLGRTAVGAVERIDLDVMGHFHMLSFLPRAFVNGSLIGYNAYAQREGFSYEDPMQLSFVVDERHRVPSNMNPIFVAEPRRLGRR